MTVLGKSKNPDVLEEFLGGLKLKWDLHMNQL